MEHRGFEPTPKHIKTALFIHFTAFVSYVVSHDIIVDVREVVVDTVVYRPALVAERLLIHRFERRSRRPAAALHRVLVGNAEH